MNEERDARDQGADEPGANREESEDASKLPAQPSDDESEAGDTDQHSSSNA
jgi:hypothetical protein